MNFKILEEEFAHDMTIDLVTVEHDEMLYENCLSVGTPPTSRFNPGLEIAQILKIFK